MFGSSMVIGPPGTRSRLTIFTCPTRAHSARICRSVASFATTVARPFAIATRTSAEAVDAAVSDVARVSAVAAARALNDICTIQYTPRVGAIKPGGLRGFSLFPAEIVDDLNEDV